MQRIWRIVPFGLSLAMLMLATLSMRWAIGCPSRDRLMAEPPPAVAAASPASQDANAPGALRLLSAEEVTGELIPTPSDAPVMGNSTDPTASGPQLTVPYTTQTVTPSETAAFQPTPGPVDPTKASLNATPWTASANAVATAMPSKEHSMQMEQIARQADQQTRHGFELAERGAHFAARAEFLAALRLVAEGLDAEQGNDSHTRALASALTALKESEAFLPAGSRVETDLNVAQTIGSHTTPILKEQADSVSPMVALRAYLTYAQQQLAASVDREVAGSIPLYALGKLHTALAQKKNSPILAPEGKAVVFFQASLMVYPKNYMAANDLGVLLARCGNPSDARAMLEHSVSLGQQASSWRNLAVVYQQLGMKAQADYAAQQVAVLQKAGKSGNTTTSVAASVQWIDPQTFAKTSPNMSTVPGPRNQMATTPGTGEPRATANRAGVDRTARNPMPQTRRWGDASESTTGADRRETNTTNVAPTPAAASRMSWGTQR